MKISAPAPDKNPGSSNPGIHPQNIGYDWFSYSFGRFSWYLGFFLLDPDPYQSSPWIRIRNKFFHILDPYQKWYGSATLVLGSKIKIKELHVKFSVFIYERKRPQHKKCTSTIFSHPKLKEAEICCYQWCGSVSYWYGFGWGSRMWKNSLRIRIRIQGELWYRSGSRKKRNGSGSSKKELCTRKIFKKCIKKGHNLCFVGILLYNPLSTTNYSN